MTDTELNNILNSINNRKNPHKYKLENNDLIGFTEVNFRKWNYSSDFYLIRENSNQKWIGVIQDGYSDLHFYIKKKYRGKGILKKLIDDILKDIYNKDNNRTVQRITTQENRLENYYIEELGFKKYKRGLFKDNISLNNGETKTIHIEDGYAVSENKYLLIDNKTFTFKLVDSKEETNPINQDELNNVLSYIRNELNKTKSINMTLSVGDLKHNCEKIVKHYTTRETMLIGMILEGYKIYSKDNYTYFNCI